MPPFKAFALGVVVTLFFVTLVVEATVRWRLRRLQAAQEEVNLRRLSPSFRRALREESNK